MKTICFWCGKDHRKYRPVKCKRAGKLMSKVCEKVDVWKAMRVIELYGISGLETLAIELGLGKWVGK